MFFFEMLPVFQPLDHAGLSNLLSGKAPRKTAAAAVGGARERMEKVCFFCSTKGCTVGVVFHVLRGFLSRCSAWRFYLSSLFSRDEVSNVKFPYYS